MKHLLKIVTFLLVFSLSTGGNNLTNIDQSLDINIDHDIPSKTMNKTNSSNTHDLPTTTSCITPNGDAAYCLPIMSCPKLFDKLSDLNARNFLRSSRCDNKQGKTTNPSVCCGKYDNYRNLSVSEEVLPKICGHQHITIRGRIVGGHEADIGEFPWMARLYHKDRFSIRRFGCSGFLISARFVLTAGHCINSSTTDVMGPIFEVHLGEHDADTEIDCNPKHTICATKLQKSRVKETYIHPLYDLQSKQYHHDIGLVALKKAAKFTDYVKPICIVQKFNFDLKEYWISGWGNTETGHLSNIKMRVSIPLFPASKCKRMYSKKNVIINENQICAGGEKNRDSCVGDSGGPLMFAKNGTWFAAGIVSYGLECGKDKWPAIYTNVTSYMDFIMDTMMTYHMPKNQSVKAAKM